MKLLVLLWKIFQNKHSMYLKFIMFIFWIISLSVSLVLLLRGLWESNINYIRIGFIGAIVSWCTMMAIYKDY